MLAVCRKAHSKEVCDMDFIRLNAEFFLSCNGDSINYAIMEKPMMLMMLVWYLFMQGGAMLARGHP